MGRCWRLLKAAAAWSGVIPIKQASCWALVQERRKQGLQEISWVKTL